MFASLIAGLGLKDLFYGTIIVAGGAFAAWYHNHVEDLGEAKIVAANAKVIAVQKAHDTDVQNAADLATKTAEQKYETVIASVAATNIAPIRVYNHSLCSGTDLPAPAGSTASTGVSPNGGAGHSTGDQAVPDPGEVLAQELDTIGRNADAKIRGLEAEVAAMRLEMTQAQGK